MWTEENSHWKPYVYSWLTKSSTQRTSFYSGATTNVPVLTEYMAFMTNVRII